ncbi:MAG: hypothetical protein HFF34_07305 [Oscillospiraceae bacterium]|jgi:hypothetical protein|nr:hypothetical protein [Oscillospiraceae bacterium]MCI9394009.1 hypothetical protein [Oscillospiraceae bacterium]MCI9581162.1 hypothetical protein [Oscillospiraceae bacterium]
MPRTKKAPDAESAAKTETAAKAKRSPKTPAEAIKRTVTRKTKPAVASFVEFQGKQVDMEQLAASIQESWTGEAIKSLKIYVKPEDGAAYYVVNDGEGGKVEL